MPGWDVLVLEATVRPGGSVRTAQLTLPGFHHDVFSAFYPLGAASPFLRRLRLEEYGLEWVHAPLVVAHPLTDGRCVVLSRDLGETAASLEGFGAGDGQAWERLFARWQRIREPVLAALFSLFPPVRAGLGLARRMPPRDLLRFARFALLPVRRDGGGGVPRPGRGAAAGGQRPACGHRAGGAGQRVPGLPAVQPGPGGRVPGRQGRCGAAGAALVRRLEARGGRVVYDAPADALEIRGNRAVAVRTAGGDVVPVGRAVIGAVDVMTLYRHLIGEERLPAAVVGDLGRFQFDNATVKVDWAIDGEVPWTAEPGRRSPHGGRGRCT